MLRLQSATLLLGFTALTSVSTTVHAQTSLYAIGGIANYGFTHPTPDATNYKGDTGGFGGGAFYNFPIDSRVTVGLDGRAAYSSGDKGGFLAGAALRVGFVPHHNPLRPYFQVGGGVVHSSYIDSMYFYDTASRVPVVTTRRSVTSGAAQFVVGLDIRLTEHFDLRAPELGAQAGGGDGIQTGVGFLNAGIVYHLRSRH